MKLFKYFKFYSASLNVDFFFRVIPILFWYCNSAQQAMLNWRFLGRKEREVLNSLCGIFQTLRTFVVQRHWFISIYHCKVHLCMLPLPERKENEDIFAFLCFDQWNTEQWKHRMILNWWKLESKYSVNKH